MILPNMSLPAPAIRFLLEAIMEEGFIILPFQMSSATCYYLTHS